MSNFYQHSGSGANFSQHAQSTSNSNNSQNTNLPNQMLSHPNHPSGMNSVGLSGVSYKFGGSNSVYAPGSIQDPAAVGKRCYSAPWIGQHQPYTQQSQQVNQDSLQQFGSSFTHGALVGRLPTSLSAPLLPHNAAYTPSSMIQAANGIGPNLSHDMSNMGYAPMNNFLPVAIPPPPPPPPHAVPFVASVPTAPAAAVTQKNPFFLLSRPGSIVPPTYDPVIQQRGSKRSGRTNILGDQPYGTEKSARLNKRGEHHGLYQQIEREKDSNDRHERLRGAGETGAFPQPQYSRREHFKWQAPVVKAKQDTVIGDVTKNKESKKSNERINASTSTPVTDGDNSKSHLARPTSCSFDSDAPLPPSSDKRNDKQIDNAIHALSELESRWATPHNWSVVPPDSVGDNKQTKKEKRKRKIINEASGDLSTKNVKKTRTDLTAKRHLENKDNEATVISAPTNDQAIPNGEFTNRLRKETSCLENTDDTESFTSTDGPTETDPTTLITSDCVNKCGPTLQAKSDASSSDCDLQAQSAGSTILPRRGDDMSQFNQSTQASQQVLGYDESTSELPICQIQPAENKACQSSGVPRGEISTSKLNDRLVEASKVSRHPLSFNGVNDEMEISEEEEDSLNTYLPHVFPPNIPDAESTAKLVESLYRDLPNDLYAKEAPPVKIEGVNSKRGPPVSLPDSEAFSSETKPVPKANEKERLNLKLAEVRAKAKLAGAKLRMAIQRKALGNISKESVISVKDGTVEDKIVTNKAAEGKIIEDKPSKCLPMSGGSNPPAQKEDDYEPLSQLGVLPQLTDSLYDAETSLRPPDITALSDISSLKIEDVTSTGAEGKVRFIENLEELSSSETLAPKIEDGDDQTHAVGESTLNLTSSQSLLGGEKLQQTKSETDDSTEQESRKKSHSLKQQLQLLKLRLEIKKKEQLLLTKKKHSAPSLKTQLKKPLTGIGNFFGNNEGRSEETATSNPRQAPPNCFPSNDSSEGCAGQVSSWNFLDTRQQRLISKEEMKLDTLTESNRLITLEVNGKLHETNEGGKLTLAGSPKSSFGPAEKINDGNDEGINMSSPESKAEKVRELKRRQKELKQKNEISNLKNLIRRQRDLLRAQGQKLTESSTQLQACVNEIKSKRELLDTSRQRLDDMNYRKRIIEGMVLRATEKLMDARKALNQRREQQS